MSNAANQTAFSNGRAGGIGRRIGPHEQLITLSQATKLLPRINGKHPATCTLWRWCRRGLRGVFLEYVRAGRRICTTREALLRFFTALADMDDLAPPALPAGLCRRPITSRQRQRALAEADRVLEEAGI